jgi:aspartate aminotransferase-like enzyme
MTDKSPLANFFVPGPTWVRPEILQELTRPMIGHRSAEFKELYRRIITNLKPLFATAQDAFIATASGTALMEASLVNCVPRRVLVTTCGAFSERWFSIAQTLGLEVDRLDAGWGNAIDPDQLADHLGSRRAHYDAVTLTHNETSTGVTNDVAALAAVVHEHSPETLVLVDAVSSLASIDVRVDEWALDVCFASVQKGIALPPGIAVFAVSGRALKSAEKNTYRGTYFDFLKYKKNGDEDSVPSTPALPHFYALAKQLEDIVQIETLPTRFARHRAMRDMTIERTAGYAEMASDPGHASNSVSALKLISGTPDEVRAAMKKRGFTLGGGYGEWKDSTFRIGHMGDISLEALSVMLDNLEQVVPH